MQSQVTGFEQLLQEKVDSSHLQQLKSTLTCMETKLSSVEAGMEEKAGANQIQQQSDMITAMSSLRGVGRIVVKRTSSNRFQPSFRPVSSR